MPATRTKSTINGISKSVVKQMAGRRFKPHFDKVVHGGDRFEVYFFESVDQDKLDEFQEEWPEFKILITANAEYKNQPLR